jgi:hypothetical protein
MFRSRLMQFLPDVSYPLAMRNPKSKIENEMIPFIIHHSAFSIQH